MITDFKYSIKPNSSLVIWRYMSLRKFKSLINNEALFFCRADVFSDPFEGSNPKRELENRNKMLNNSSIFENGFIDVNKTQQTDTNIANLHSRLKSCYNINCWHINNAENDSMWQLYLKNNKGVAIKTTVGKLIQSFANTQEEINCSKVRYLDYENDEYHDSIEYPIDEYNTFIPIVHKRIEFKHEEELRLVYYNSKALKSGNPQKYWKKQKIKEGVNIKVDLGKLIEKIYCPPTSTDYNIKKIQKHIKKIGYNFQIEKSILGDSPNF